LYVKGGGAVVSDEYDVFNPPAAGGALLGSASETRWGATVGVGAEFAFAHNWSVGLEYDHIFLGHRNVGFTSVAGAPFGNDSIGQDVDMGLVRLNYRWGGPAVARY
ncbi:MAG: outer membrane beta-barrel protein, partial [Bradyrhizobium sp.]|uniref:outer membrane protein n=1 Tax=Bradyrhizobium sp. TaxID=376 RepID=UPI0025C2E5E0